MIALARIARGTAARITIIALGVVGLSAGAAICAPSPNTPASSDASKPAVAATTSKSSDAAPLAPAAVAKTQSKKDEKPLEPISKRFAAAISRETPSFQRHVTPLLGKLGCNGRACHGSFQGRGGFRLSLFGYDFKMDHDALMAGEEGPRVNVKNPDASLILQKPTLRMDHEGGKRYELGSWEHHVLLKWIQSGAPGVKPGDPTLARLEVRPAEIRFAKKGEKVALRAIAHWTDGTSEDVTPLCRYQSNDEQIAKIDTTGQVTAVEPGDSHVVAFYDAGVTPVPVMQPVSDVVGDKYPAVATPTEIDRLVVQKLRKLGIVPSDVCTDAEYLRRVSLDLTGTLPTADEVVKFLADKSPEKRHKKVDELLERPTYVAWWTTRLCDLTGNTDRSLANITPVNTKIASEEWYDWIEKRVRQNVPYDKLVAGIVLATSRPLGQTYTEYSDEMTALYRKTPAGNYADHPGLTHFWARRNIGQPAQKALSFAYTFLGIRIQCAECHKHPFDQWTQDDYKDFTKFFTRVRYGTNPEDAAERKELYDSLHLDAKKLVDIRREYPRLIAEGKTLPFDELFVAPLRTRGSLMAQRPGALRPQAKGKAKAKDANGTKAKMADASRPRKPLAAQRPQAAGKTTKPIVAQRDDKKTADGKSGQTAKNDPAKNDAKSPTKKPGERKPLVALRPGQKPPAIAAKRRQPQPIQDGTARLLGAGVVDLTKYDDPRTPLMDWLRAKNNRFFARAFVNRVWANYFNVGIVNPPDDLSLSNPPSNAALLDYLANGFIKHNYDMKWLHREITSSRTYQMSWKPNATNRLDQRNFSHAVLRRLPAEVAYDAVRQATSSDQAVAGMQADCSDRAIGIAGTTRRGGRAISPYALGLFGRSVRETNCDCDRSNEPSLLQTVFLRNDNEMLSLVSNPRTGWIAQIASELQPKPTGKPRPAGKKVSGTAKMAASNKDVSKKDIVKKDTLKQQPANDGLKTVLAKNDTTTPDTTKKDIAKKDPVKKDAAKKDAKNVGDRNGETLTPEQKARRIAQITARLQKAQEAGDARQVKLITLRLEEVKRLPTKTRPAAVPIGVMKPSQLALSKKKDLIRTVYLRTLSRYPKDQESDRALAYLNSSDNVFSGLRDVVWAVVNTEEFIVNH
jgi:hypothetical protein